jgi:hypothetical protein
MKYMNIVKVDKELYLLIIRGNEMDMNIKLTKVEAEKLVTNLTEALYPDDLDLGQQDKRNEVEFDPMEYAE